ncbi:MAG: zonular occludens toxin domain-containing protein [Nitrososphaeria archaeon]
MKTHASVLLTAQSGSGKSYLASYLIQKINCKRKWIIDRSGEYNLPGFIIFDLTAANIHELPIFLSTYAYVTIRPEFLRRENEMRVINYIAQLAFEMRNTFIVFEECHEYIDKKDPKPYIQSIATAGRKYGINSLFITQRPNLLNSTIRSQTNFKIAGKMTDPRDYEAIRPYFANYWIIPRLPPRHFLFRTPDGTEFIFSTENIKVEHYG